VGTPEAFFIVPLLTAAPPKVILPFLSSRRSKTRNQWGTREFSMKNMGHMDTWFVFDLKNHPEILIYMANRHII